MKSIIRFLTMVLIVGGWGLAALAVYVVRTPDPSNPQQSKLVVIPKNELDWHDTYVDARGWTMANIADHQMLMHRVVFAGKADEFKFLADPKSKDDITTQLIDVLSEPVATTERSATTARATIGPSRR
ncbi:MAG TPA: hypothetical protein VGG44_06395 [Tepidisphaeraceae bacterium]